MSDRDKRRSRLKDDAKNLRSNVRKMFKETNQTPVEEAAAIAAASSTAGEAVASYSHRWQERLRFSIRWLQALEETAKFAHESFGQVMEEALLDDESDETITERYKPGEEPPFVVTEFPADFATDQAGETEKIAGTEPPPPMNREQRRRAAAEGRPAGPPKGPPQTPPKDNAFKGLKQKPPKR